jgi:GxxExxY protein
MPFEGEDPPYVEPDPELSHWTGVTIGAAIEVHKRLGPGLDETLYAAAMWRELTLRGVPFEKEVLVPVEYKGEIIGKKRIDLIVAGKIIVELKVVEILSPLHSAQLRTYLKITRLKLGLLINFNSIILKDGIRRVINSEAFSSS